jgi:small-conductance mechanosensitive channel
MGQNNSWGQYFTAAILWAGLTAFAWAVKRWGLPRLKFFTLKTANTFDDHVIEGLKTHLPAFLYLGAFVAAVHSLNLPAGGARGVRLVVALWLLWACVRAANGVARFFIFQVWLGPRGDNNLALKIQSLTPFLTILLWLAGLIILLDNFGFKISALIAGLGIGGVAVALASQAILGDLFSYLAILFDKPFEPGDFIIVGDMMGTVENIGIKTTRLRSISGEQLVFSNTDLTGSRVRNFKRMQERRVLFRLGVAYDTPSDRLADIPQRLRAIIQTVPGTRFDRAHFATFGPSSLDFEVVFFVLSSDYNTYMDIQQTIHLAIKNEFDARGVAFAFPTQTIHIASGPTPTESKG